MKFLKGYYQVSIQNAKTLKAYQKVAKNYLGSTKLANSTYKENAIRAKKELQDFIKKLKKDKKI